MSAQPVEQPGNDPRDPAVIVERLPEQVREQFLREYEAAMTAAAHEVWRYKEVQKLLQQWSLLAAAYSKTDFLDRAEDVKHGRGEYVPLDEVVAKYHQAR